MVPCIEELLQLNLGLPGVHELPRVSTILMITDLRPNDMTQLAASSKDNTATVPERNKKWKAYVFIGVASFVNFVSIADVLGVESAQHFFHLDEQQSVDVMFGLM